VLRRICGPNREEVAGGWRRLRIEELHSLHTSPNIIRVIKSRRMIWEGHVACMGEISAYNILVGKHERMRPLGRDSRGMEDNIRMDLREIGWEGVEWLHIA
jgi:hypothetical protein